MKEKACRLISRFWFSYSQIMTLLIICISTNPLLRLISGEGNSQSVLESKTTPSQVIHHVHMFDCLFVARADRVYLVYVLIRNQKFWPSSNLVIAIQVIVTVKTFGYESTHMMILANSKFKNKIKKNPRLQIWWY